MKVRMTMGVLVGVHLISVRMLVGMGMFMLMGMLKLNCVLHHQPGAHRHDDQCRIKDDIENRLGAFFAIGVFFNYCSV